MSETIHKPPAFTPEILILVSGKRKSGKDHVTDMLISRLFNEKSSLKYRKRFTKEKTAVMRIAAPIKHYWSVKNNLDYEKMLDASDYKEKHRFEMVKWSQEVRQENYGYFNVEAIKMAHAVGKPVWICADIRHKRDYKWFQEFYPDIIKRIRVVATEDTRKSRGWIYTSGIDDGPSECGLDSVTDWDLVVTNNGESTNKEVEEAVNTIVNWLPKPISES